MLKPYILISSKDQIHTSNKACYTWGSRIHISGSTPLYRGVSALCASLGQHLAGRPLLHPTHYVGKPCSIQVQEKMPLLTLAQPASTILCSKPGNFPQPVIQIVWFVKDCYWKLCKDLSSVCIKQPVKLYAGKSQGKKHHIKYIMTDAKPSILS